ncbi:MAG: CvpA family protein [Thermodesulfobacteriota bacterium]
MNTLDIILLIIISVSIIYSLIRGLVREIFSLLAIILGFLGASYGSATVGRWLSRWISNETLALIVGFLILFVLIALIISLSGKTLSRIIKKMDLGWADHMGGAAFGFIKAILLIAIILLIMTAFLPSKSKLLSESVISPAVLNIARGLSFLIPEKFRNIYLEKEKDLRKYWATKELAADKSPPLKGQK